MNPDFNSHTVETIAKRAAFCCSNPECGVSTVGPNTAPDKATMIGEAAHIYGARAGSARYDVTMLDAMRSEITNAIWLCRNCHKKIDRDAEQYTAELLFLWREAHDKMTALKLGQGDQLKAKLATEEFAAFEGYPSIIRRILIDRPDGWEWRLTAELLRHLNSPLFRKLEDLRNGHYTQPIQRIADDDIIEWVQTRLTEMQVLINPMKGLLGRLSRSWGEPGETGNIEEIHHTCRLISDNLKQIIRHEESLRFVTVSEGFENLVILLMDCLGSQADKLADIPSKLDKIAEMAIEHSATENSEPLVITETIVIDLPPGWEKEFSRELKRIEHVVLNGVQIEEDSGGGISSWVVFFFIMFLLFVFAL